MNFLPDLAFRRGKLGVLYYCFTQTSHVSASDFVNNFGNSDNI